MKKIMSMMLGLSLMMGTVALFADEVPPKQEGKKAAEKTAPKTKKKKSKKTTDSTTPPTK